VILILFIAKVFSQSRQKNPGYLREPFNAFYFIRAQINKLYVFFVIGSFQKIDILTLHRFPPPVKFTIIVFYHIVNDDVFHVKLVIFQFAKDPFGEFNAQGFRNGYNEVFYRLRTSDKGSNPFGKGSQPAMISRSVRFDSLSFTASFYSFR
jgi:hypothetical protein